MKKHLLLIVFILSIHGVNAQYVSIPDVNFRTYLMHKMPGCFNAAKKMDTTCPAVLARTVVNYDDSTIKYSGKNLDGIQYLKSLTSLTWSTVESIPSFPATLKTIKLTSNKISPYPALPGSLIDLDISDSYAGNVLPTLPSTLQVLNISKCFMTAMPSLPSSLLHLKSPGNKFQSMPALPNSLLTIDCSDIYFIDSIHSLPNSLTSLVCNNGNLSYLPPLPATLKEISCWNQNLSSIPALPSGLQQLTCSDNLLSSLPALPATLTLLRCGENHLSSLPALPQGLLVLECQENYTLLSHLPTLASLPTLPNGLQELDCSQNPLISSLPNLPSSLQKLIVFGCSINSLPALPIGLQELDCANNALLSSLPNVPPTLQTMNIIGCSFTTLPTLPSTLVKLFARGNMIGTSVAGATFPSSLIYIDLQATDLYQLPHLPPHLQGLSVADNPRLKCLPVLPASLRTMFLLQTDSINCLPNIPNDLFELYWRTPLPVCSPLNNKYGCAAFPSVYGTVFHDRNMNGIRDNGETVRQNTRVTSSNGTYSFTDQSGEYALVADTLAPFSVHCDVPQYFNSVPDSVMCTLTSGSLQQDFAMQVATPVDSVVLYITPVGDRSRPGMPFHYVISYRNDGTTDFNNANISVTYDSARLTYGSTSIAAVTHSGNQLFLQIPSLPYGAAGSFVSSFLIKTNVMLDDTIRASALLNAQSLSATDSTWSKVRASFDPNDKTGTPSLTPEQVISGNYIDYTIRYQNTGTDTAFDVAIADTLSNLLQWNTLEMIASTHLTKATVKNKVVTFEMRNIMLPDSNVNERASHGFVRFRIKPKNTVTAGTDIPNKAAIYFDYNAPVITNTAITQVRNVVFPLKLIRFRGVRRDNKDQLYWSTTNEVNTKYFEVERSADGRKFGSAGFVYARGRGDGEYSFFDEASGDISYYRLRMVDIDGRYNYSTIIAIRGESKAAFELTNNPVTDKLVITVLSSALTNTEARLMNSAGVVVKTFVVKGTGTQSFAVDLPAGVYYLTTVMGSEKVVVR